MADLLHEERTNICPDCNGRGHIAGDPCGTCAGDGVTEDDGMGDFIACTSCDGGGCETCNGRGGYHWSELGL